MSELRSPCLYRGGGDERAEVTLPIQGGGDERAEVALPIQGGSLQEQKRGHKKDPL